VKLPFRLKLYIGLISALAVGIVSTAWAFYPENLGRLDFFYAGFLTAMVGVSGRFPLQIAPKRKMTVTTAAMTAAVLLLPRPLAVVACSAGKALAQSGQKAPVLQKIFNTASTTVQIGISSFVFQELRQGSLAADLTANMAPIACAAVIQTATNLCLVEGIVSLQLKRRPFRGWWVSHRKEIPHEGSLHLLGVFGAVVASLYPWALLLLLAPVMIVYRSLRDGLQLQVQTRETVETLADIVDMRDHYTFEHSKRVAEMARDLAMAMKLGADEAEQIYVAARVHDVGKIGIKGQILLKEGKLTEDEWREMSSHPEVGAKLVSKLPEFRKGRELILSHHERYDGKGYPRALRGEEIPLGARIITVVDSFDAMTSNRSYRTARDPEYVLAELAKGRGTQFDPRVVDAFLKALKEKAPAAPSSAEHSHAQAFPT
jgi:HD-GYP domain-containing protein (c-di-GMP phosphodiesterase class II)